MVEQTRRPRSLFATRQRKDFLHLFDAVADRFGPDVVVGYGGDQLQRPIFSRAKARGLATIGRVAAEAACNGIPVLASDRGALPDVLAGAGTTLPLPAHLSSRDRPIPSAEELKDWIGAIIAIYERANDPEAARVRARHHAGRWIASAPRSGYGNLFNFPCGRRLPRA